MTFDEAMKAGAVTQAQAFEIFDSLPTVRPDDMFGLWMGGEFPSGHPTDGQLARGGWFGKRFKDTENVDPLVFYDGDGKSTFAADPVKLVQASAQGLSDRPCDHRASYETQQPAARLRSLEYRGKTTATMIYDQLPIFDHFRRVDQNTVLGAMDARGDSATFFFVLRRVS